MSEEEIRLDAEAVEARFVDGEVVAYDLRHRRYLGGNRAAAALWRQLAEGTTVERLARELEDAYGIDAERAGADALRFVESLRSQGLLTGPVDSRREA